MFVSAKLLLGGVISTLGWINVGDWTAAGLAIWVWAGAGSRLALIELSSDGKTVSVLLWL